MTDAAIHTTDKEPDLFRHFILGTAGHIDHGKTSLVRALTGIDTDRLPEEKRRGMTIELGFANLTLGQTRFGIVDVPGHERFVRTMVAGATGIDLALIVVAADDSVMPQTREHIEILHLLGVSLGVVAVTKIDMVDKEMVELVMDDVQELLAGTSLEGSTILPVSSTTGEGLEKLKEALLSATREVIHKPVAPPFRMAIDRVFTIQGRGTVVTGSVLRGKVSEGDTIDVWPGQQACRVRGLQAHGKQADLLERGQRAAVNLSGIDRDHLARGVELATPGYLEPTRMIDVKLECLSSYGRHLKSTTLVRLELAAREVRARLILLEGSQLEPGASAYAQLRCGEWLTAAYGQRFILRDENAQRTIGGGVILRPLGLRRRGDVTLEQARLQQLEKGAEADRCEEVLRAARFNRPTDLQLCLRTGIELETIPHAIEYLIREKRYVPIGHTDIHTVPAALDDLRDRLIRWLDRFHRQHRELPGKPIDSVMGYLERMVGRNLARPLFEIYQKKKVFKLLGRFACLPAFAPELSAADEKLLTAMVEEIRQGGFQPPLLDAMTLSPQGDKRRWQRLATLAVAMGELVNIAPKLYLHAEFEVKLREEVTDSINHNGGVTVAQVREKLNSSRKYVVPFLEYLDRCDFTQRTGDVRILATSNNG